MESEPLEPQCPHCIRKDQQLEGLGYFVANLATRHESLLQAQKDHTEIMTRLIEDRNKAIRERDEALEKFDKATFAISS